MISQSTNLTKVKFKKKIKKKTSLESSFNPWLWQECSAAIDLGVIIKPLPKRQNLSTFSLLSSRRSMLAGWLAGLPLPPSLPPSPPNPRPPRWLAVPYVVNGKNLSSRCVHAREHHKSRSTVFLYFCNSPCCCLLFFLRGLGERVDRGG